MKQKIIDLQTKTLNKFQQKLNVLLFSNYTKFTPTQKSIPTSKK